MAHSSSNICTKNYWYRTASLRQKLSLVVGWYTFSRHGVNAVIQVWQVKRRGDITGLELTTCDGGDDQYEKNTESEAGFFDSVRHRCTQTTYTQQLDKMACLVATSLAMIYLTNADVHLVYESNSRRLPRQNWPPEQNSDSKVNTRVGYVNSVNCCNVPSYIGLRYAIVKTIRLNSQRCHRRSCLVSWVKPHTTTIFTNEVRKYRVGYWSMVAVYCASRGKSGPLHDMFWAL